MKRNLLQAARLLCGHVNLPGFYALGSFPAGYFRSAFPLLSKDVFTHEFPLMWASTFKYDAPSSHLVKPCNDTTVLRTGAPMVCAETEGTITAFGCCSIGSLAILRVGWPMDTGPILVHVASVLDQAGLVRLEWRGRAFGKARVTEDQRHQAGEEEVANLHEGYTLSDRLMA